MFFKLVLRNSKRNRKENGLFFSSLVISIIAFYIVLSLPKQDVMIFLKDMESDAVDKLLSIIPVFFCAALFLLFFLIYYAGKFELERRRHEVGVYFMMGMNRTRLFFLLLFEDLGNSIAALFLGLPAAVFLSEIISLVTSRLVGLGIVGHQTSFSLNAVLWTTVGFAFVKLLAFLIHSIRLCRQEIGHLLTESPVGIKRQFPSALYLFSCLAGILCFIFACMMAVTGEAWIGIEQMTVTITLGIFGTMAFFWGLRIVISFVIKAGKGEACLRVFNFRQIQETVIYRSTTLAVCSLLLLAALCCMGAGIGISSFYGKSEQHILDYTFQDSEGKTDTKKIRQILADRKLDASFSRLFDMKTGQIRTADDTENAFQMDNVLNVLQQMEGSDDRDVLINNLSYETYPYLISLSSYNHVLEAAQLSKLALQTDEAAIYMDHEFTDDKKAELLNKVLETRPEVRLDGNVFHLKGTVQTTSLVTDRSITLSFALILPDEMFEYFTKGQYTVYLNGILKTGSEEKGNLMSVIAEMNRKLDKTELHYESYLQNMGRQLFYMVSSSYITIYLAIIFFLIANTIIGVQFLISQRKSNRRYRILIHLGAVHAVLCKAARKQIDWYFGIPIAVAAGGSLFGVRGLLTGILPSYGRNNVSDILFISTAVILTACVIECSYIFAVKRSSDHYLLTLMVPERKE